MLRTTPFHPRTSELMQGYAWRRWAGYAMASAYELSHEREYAAIRSAAALFDVTPLYKYHVSGPDALRLMNRVVTRDVAKCSVGQMMYTPWCDEQGKVMDDGTVSRLDEQRFRLTSADPNLRWLHENAVGLHVTIEDVSDSIAALSLQGPTSRDILMQMTDDCMGSLKFFRVATADLCGVPVTVSRTGYTGDLGYELWVDNERALALWDAVVETGASYGLQPAGLLALDIARLEAGLILIDVDYVSARRALIELQKSSPFELNLGWTVALDKPHFVGQRALVAEREREPSWRLVGLEVDWESLERLYVSVGLPARPPATAWRTSVPVYAGGRQVGYATSGTWSPLLKKYIALAHLEAEHAGTDSVLEMEITVEHRRKRARAHVKRTPFFDPERKKG
ncbi:MAG TPA: aminomethyltransferase family protein [Gemmatimonadaceae bacterium]|nr:aminomethyltransferase family protein [Gemmatimonadaceae bacterium]